MTKRVLIQSRELEVAAEKAGGFVAAPGSLERNPQGETEFTIMRQYSLKHKIPMSKLTGEDYKNMGIKQ